MDALYDAIEITHDEAIRLIRDGFKGTLVVSDVSAYAEASDLDGFYGEED